MTQTNLLTRFSSHEMEIEDFYWQEAISKADAFIKDRFETGFYDEFTVKEAKKFADADREILAEQFYDEDIENCDSVLVFDLDTIEAVKESRKILNEIGA